MTEIVTTLLGLVIGVLTGYYFENRSSKETRVRNAELQEQLLVLRESIYAVGRGDGSASSKAGAAATDLGAEMKRWLQEYQGPDGKISHTRVVARFLERGFSSEQINAALVQLDEQGVIVFGDVVEIR